MIYFLLLKIEMFLFILFSGILKYGNFDVRSFYEALREAKCFCVANFLRLPLFFFFFYPGLDMFFG